MRLSAGEGTKGARIHKWGCIELADLDPGQAAIPAASSTIFSV